MPPSGSPPPSYTSHPNSQEERLYTQHFSSFPAKFDGDAFGDTKSTKSRSFVDTPSADLAALKSISGGRVRKGKCPPEFLAEVAKEGIPQVVLDKYDASRFKVITGKEGSAFYERFLGERNNDVPLPLYDETIARNDIAPLVFAVPVYDAVGRKCVDYYMTWRGKIPRVHDLRGAERRISMLDDEFKKLVLTLDKENKKARSSKGSSGSGKSSSSRRKEPVYQTKENVAPSTPHRKPSPPPEIVVPELAVRVTDSPVSANPSVISLPTLTMIPGVPRSHHLPLRIVNPDATETASSVDDAPELPTPRTLETLVEAAETADPTNENAEILVHQTPRVTAPPAVIRPPSSETGSERSSHSSKSSRSSESRRDRDRDDAGRYHESSRRHSSREHDHDHDHRRERKHSSRHDDSRRKKEKPLGDEEFVIVVLDDKMNDGTWHGMQRQPSARTPARTRSSPWSGPLAQQDFITRRYPVPRTHHHSPLDSGESEEESSDSEIEGWDETPVIPLKAYMEAMGYVPPASRAPHPVVTSPMQYQQRPPLVTSFPSPQTSVTSMPYNSPYQVINSSQPASPYVPAWMKVSPQQQHTPLSRSTYTPSPIYASPYAQTHQVAPY